MNAYKMLIDGQLVDGARIIPVIDPSTGEPFAQAHAADGAQIDEAVASAARAFPAWAAAPWETRRACLLEFAQRLENETDSFTHLLIRE
ncbi:MAG: aldehyde dehydrogenase family protein, partial [Alphaproteobacteria bacterium]|nr:aldehyde dehydrogenase family protein [Alphaproteobacteria bacterium]MBU1463202.1 aldehyde dehydrogenase family protein [Alphaproteobacteria bacterium]